MAWSYSPLMVPRLILAGWNWEQSRTFPEQCYSSSRKTSNRLKKPLWIYEKNVYHLRFTKKNKNTKMTPSVKTGVFAKKFKVVHTVENKSEKILYRFQNLASNVSKESRRTAKTIINIWFQFGTEESITTVGRIVHEKRFWGLTPK